MTADDYQKVKRIFNSALDAAPAERGKFVAENCLENVELRQQVEKLLAAHEDAEDFIETPAVAVVSESFLGEAQAENFQIDRYKIIREIGRGGMGAVFLAERADAEFKQQVAVKVIKRGMDTDEILRRFRQERQILAELNHPNIARLLDGGTTADGLPYFVMEYVEGLPLNRFCAELELDTNARLEIFRRVCAAAQYAHQHLIVHRDIKPSNILVTADGTPKLLDFGIAKLLSQDENQIQTATAFSAMTPEYASPEQMRGEKITTATDVYSLGKILSELLELEEETEKKTKTENRRPKTDLQAILQTALREESEKRYSSVAQFSEDVRRYLSGLPVIAQKDTFRYRTGKFVRRNKIGVSAATLILLSLITGFSVAVWQAQVARSNSRVAQIEREKAERRFADVRRLANSFMFEIHDQIENLPGATPAREMLVRRALEYLDSLATEAGGDLELQRELAAAYEKVGNVQGNPNGANLGDTKGALESYRKAQEIREKLLAVEPENSSYRNDLAAIYQLLGETLWWTSETDGAMESYLKARRLREDLIESEPGDLNFKLRFVETQMAIGYLDFWNGHTQQALENYNPALVVLERLAAEQPANVEVLRTLGNCHTQVGDAWSWDGDAQKALVHFDKALAILEPLQKANPNDFKLRRFHYLAYLKKGETLADTDFAKALPSYQTALQIAEASLAADTQNFQVRRDLSISYNKIGDALAGLKRFPEAFGKYEKALEIQTHLAAENSKNAEARRDLANTHNRVGEAQIRAGDFAAALKNYQQALEIRESLAAADTKDSVRRRDVAISCRNIANTYVKSAASFPNHSQKINAWQTALYWYQRSREIYFDLRRSGAFRETEAKDLEKLEVEISNCEISLRDMN